MRTLSISVLAALCVAPCALGAQDARLTSRLDAPTAMAVSAIVDSARLAGLPSEPIVEKALQGAAKHAANARIIAAAAQLSHELAGARDAIGAQSSEAELVAAAGALHAGASAKDLAAIRQDRRGSPLTVPLATLADLVAQGVPVADAVQTIETLAQGRASDEQFLAMRGEVAGDIAHGAAPGAAARLRAAGVGAHGPPMGIPPGRGHDKGKPGRP